MSHLIKRSLDFGEVYWLLLRPVHVLAAEIAMTPVISLQTQVPGGITSQRNKWANADPLKYWRRDQVPRRSKHRLLIGHTHHEPSFLIK
jgi:hypothetical protein